MHRLLLLLIASFAACASLTFGVCSHKETCALTKRWCPGGSDSGILTQKQSFDRFIKTRIFLEEHPEAFGIVSLDVDDRINVFVVTGNDSGEHVCMSALWGVTGVSGYRRKIFEHMRSWHDGIFDEARLVPNFIERSDIDAWNGVS